MIKATPENTFIGSVVEKRGETFNVYKVNKNFVWAGKSPYHVIASDWEFKEKGITWNSIMESRGAKKLIFSNLMLNEILIDGVIQKKNFSKKIEIKDKYANACCKKELEKAYGNYRHKKNYKYIILCHTCDKELKIIEAYEDGRIMFNSEYKQVYYDVNEKVTTLYKDLLNGDSSPEIDTNEEE